VFRLAHPALPREHCNVNSRREASTHELASITVALEQPSASRQTGRPAPMIEPLVLAS